jgi:hypothetical protein
MRGEDEGEDEEWSKEEDEVWRLRAPEGEEKLVAKVEEPESISGRATNECAARRQRAQGSGSNIGASWRERRIVSTQDYKLNFLRCA